MGQMTKTALVVQNFPKLSETFVCRQAEFLEATVVCEGFSPSLYDELGLKLSCYPLHKRNELFRFLKRAASKTGFYFDYWDRGQQREVASFLEREKIDLVLAQFGPNGIKIAPVCETLNIPLVIHFHGYDLSRLPRLRSYSAALRQALDVAQSAIVVNEQMRQRLRRLGVAERKIHFIPYGVDTERHHPETRATNGVCTFLAVGRLVDKKAPLLTIKAFERCARQTGNVRLQMIGDGPLFETIEAYVSASDQQAHVDLLGARPHSEVEAALKSADVFVQHSVRALTGDEEGWPNSIAEAAATGLPTIATRHGGIPTQVVDGQTGYLVEEGDYEAMGDRMVRLACDAELRQQMGQEARKHIEANGDLQASLRRLEEVLRTARNWESKPAIHPLKPLLRNTS